MCRVIAISGTPGVGKTSIARAVSRILNIEAIDLSDLVVKKQLYMGYDEERRSYIVDEDLVKKELKSMIHSCGNEKKYILVEGHYAEIVDDDDLEILFILRLDPRELVKRLCMRGWDLRKSLENGEAEYLGICLFNALEEHPREKICEIDVTGKEPESVARRIVDIVERRGKCDPQVDWTALIEPEDLWEAAAKYCAQSL